MGRAVRWLKTPTKVDGVMVRYSVADDPAKLLQRGPLGFIDAYGSKSEK